MGGDEDLVDMMFRMPSEGVQRMMKSMMQGGVMWFLLITYGVTEQVEGLMMELFLKMSQRPEDAAVNMARIATELPKWVQFLLMKMFGLEPEGVEL